MKKVFIITSITFSIFFISCEEDFNPKTEFEEKYALYGVIESTPPEYTQIVRVAVLNTYDVNGFNPAIDHSDHSVSGCRITIINGNNESLLSEGLLNPIPVGNGYYRLKHVYMGGFKAEHYKEIKIKVELPNGKVLTAGTHIPEMLSHLQFSYPFNTGIHTRLDRFRWGNTWKIELDSNNDNLFFPKLTLYYSKITDSGLKGYSKEIPMRYVKKGGKFEAVYPTYIWDKTFEYNFDCFDSVMTQISAGDSLKQNYIIGNITLGIIEYERNLASYYSSINGYLDNFSIRLDESVYTNVSGGFGVFGACTPTYQSFNINRVYAESFGYTVQ